MRRALLSLISLLFKSSVRYRVSKLLFVIFFDTWMGFAGKICDYESALNEACFELPLKFTVCKFLNRGGGESEDFLSPVLSSLTIDLFKRLQLLSCLLEPMLLLRSSFMKLSPWYVSTVTG